MSTKSAIIILAVIVIIGSVFMVYMFKYMPPVSESPEAINIKPPETAEKIEPPKKEPLTTQQKKERIDEIFKELNSNSSEEDLSQDIEEKTQKTNEIFKELNTTENTQTQDSIDSEEIKEKEKRINDIFKELNN